MDYFSEIATHKRAVEYLCAKNDIPTNFLQSTIECFMRLPFATPAKTLELIKSIHEMADQKIDFSLLLKAGVAMGMSYDYSRFKESKRQLVARAKRNKDLRKKLAVMLENVKRNKYDAELVDGISGPQLHIKVDIEKPLEYKKQIPNSLFLGEWTSEAYRLWALTPKVFQEIAQNIAPSSNILYREIDIDALFSEYITRFCDWHIECVQKLLSLDMNRWKINSLPINQSPFVFFIEQKNPMSNIVCVRNDPFLRGSPFDISAIYVDEPMLADNENLSFIAIYQKCLLDHHHFRVKTELEHLFAVKNHRVPDHKELESLRMRYYNFVRSAYPSEMAELAESDEEPRTPRLLLGPGLHVNEAPNVFFLRSRSYKRKKDSCKDRNPYIVGKMLYDLEKQCYWLMRGSRLDNIDEQKLSKFPELADIYKNARQNRSIVVHRLNMPSSKVDDAKPSPNASTEQSKITVCFVHKRIKLHSASLAALMVLGYKRNGLDCWKNGDGQTLREYLESIKRSPVRKVSTKSVSAHPKDPEEHPSDDSATPALR